MAEVLRVVGVEGGVARPPLPLAGLAAARVAAGREVLARAGLLLRVVAVLRAAVAREAVLRLAVLARAAGRARLAVVAAAGVAAGLVLVLVAGAGVVVVAGAAAEPLPATGWLVAPLLVGAGAVGGLVPVELLEGVAAMLVVRVRRGGRLAMVGEERRLGAGWGCPETGGLASRPAPRNR